MNIIQDVAEEIKKAEQELTSAIERAGLYRNERGYYEWRNPMMVRQINQINAHIHNLKLKLNRLNQKQWGKRLQNKEE